MARAGRGTLAAGSGDFSRFLFLGWQGLAILAARAARASEGFGPSMEARLFAMDDIDIYLEQAWGAVANRLTADPQEIKRRLLRRRLGKCAARPLRNFCLGLRASDTRITPMTAYIEPEYALQTHEPHVLIIDGTIVRKLNEPLLIPWPGVPLFRAGKRLGATREMLRRWIKRGVLEIQRHDYCRKHRKGGCKPIPIIFTPGPMDPTQVEGRPPHEVWGALWSYKHKKFPEDFRQKLWRVPRLRPWRGTVSFRGWDWLCPGLVREGDPEEPRENEHDTAMDLTPPTKCGRLCRYLFAPLEPWDMVQSHCGARSPFANRVLELERELDAEGIALRPWWQRGVGKRRFACKHCWDVRSMTMTRASGWNDFVTAMTRGAVYGHEVEQPARIIALRRKEPSHRRRPRKRPDVEPLPFIRPDEPAARLAAG